MLVWDAGEMVYGGEGKGYTGIPVLSTPCCCEPTTALKIKSICQKHYVTHSLDSNTPPVTRGQSVSCQEAEGLLGRAEKMPRGAGVPASRGPGHHLSPFLSDKLTARISQVVMESFKNTFMIFVEILDGGEEGL